MECFHQDFEYEATGRIVGFDPCDEVDHQCIRPAEPYGDKCVWYRGWELGYSFESEYWGGEGWIAYKGGCDLGAPEIRAGRYVLALDAIDDEEDE